MTTNKDRLDKTETIKIRFNSRLARVISQIENSRGVCLLPIQSKEQKSA